MGILLLPDTIAGFEDQFGQSEVHDAAAACGLAGVAREARLTHDQRTGLLQALRRAAGMAPAEAPVVNSLPEAADHPDLHDTPAPPPQAPVVGDPPEPQSPAEAAPSLPPSDSEGIDDAPPSDTPHGDSLRQAVAAQEQQVLRLKASHSRMAAQLKKFKQTATEQAAEMRALRRKLGLAQRAAEKHALIAKRAEARVARLQARLDEQRSAERERVAAAVREANQTIAKLREKLSLAKKQQATAVRVVPHRQARQAAPRARLRKTADQSPVDAWAERVADEAAGFSVETPVVVLGQGPVSYRSMKARLVARDMDIVGPGDPSAAILIVGRQGWLIDDIEAQIKARSGDDLCIYSQEMILAALQVDSDPFATARERELLAFAKDHPALTACREEGFLWPRVNTVRVTQMLESSIEQAAESPLHKLGYRVGYSGLDADDRREVLRRCFSGKLPPVESTAYMRTWGRPGTRRRMRRMVNTIHWMLLSDRGRNAIADMSRAIDHRTDDLNWMRRELYEDWMAFRWPGTGHGFSLPRVPGIARRNQPVVMRG